jgi:hypothetical protein
LLWREKLKGGGMAYQRKTWREKLADDKGLPKIITIKPHQERRWGKGTMIVPAPREVDELIRKIRKGKTATISDLRIALARKHHTSSACPITTGIFTWIAAHAAAEAEAAGAKRVTPWWRVLKGGGKLNPKFPGGIAEQRRRLQNEGHEVSESKVLHS